MKLSSLQHFVKFATFAAHGHEAESLFTVTKSWARSASAISDVLAERRGRQPLLAARHTIATGPYLGLINETIYFIGPTQYKLTLGLQSSIYRTTNTI